MQTLGYKGISCTGYCNCFEPLSLETVLNTHHLMLSYIMGMVCACVCVRACCSSAVFIQGQQQLREPPQLIS